MSTPNPWGDAQTLRLNEAVPLAAALVFSVCDRLGLRALLLKGAPATELGLRQPRQATDVDLLLPVEDVPRIVVALEELGWKERPVTPDGDHPVHSITLYHQNWPNDIDVHFSFPGMDDDAPAAFEALWRHRRECHLAGIPVQALDRPGTLLIQALHALRELHKMENLRELQNLLSVDTNVEWKAFHNLAAATGSLGALRPYISRAYPTVDVTSLPEPSEHWRRRAGIHAPGVHRLLYLRQLRWDKRPAYVWRALFPTREMLAATDLTLLDATAAQLRHARLRRLGGFVVSGPAVIRQWFQFRKQ